MNKIELSALISAILLTFSAGTLAQTMSASDYQLGKDNIKAQYKAAKEKCNSLSGNAEDICEIEAKGQEKISIAELDAKNEPNDKTRFKVLMAKAEADFELAKEKCDDLSGNAKDVCKKEAKAAYVNAESNAKVQNKTNEAHDKGHAEVHDAHRKVREKQNDVRQDAAEDKANAAYAIEKEKCDVFSGDAKDQCINRAKRQFGM